MPKLRSGEKGEICYNFEMNNSTKKIWISLIIIIILLIIAGGISFYYINLPPLSENLTIYCNLNDCNTTSIGATLTDFNMTENDKLIKVKVGPETNFIILTGIYNEIENSVDWAEFYPLFDNIRTSGDMPIAATVYGEWLNRETFKASDIRWSQG